MDTDKYSTTYHQYKYPNYTPPLNPSLGGAVGGRLRELTTPSAMLITAGSNPGVIQRAVPPQAGGSTKSTEGNMLTVSHYLYPQGGYWGMANLLLLF